MTLELLQWISPAVIVGVMLYLHRLTRQDIKGLRGEITDLRTHVDAEIGTLRNRIGRLGERMARLEGTLDVLRQFLVRNGRNTA